MFKLSKTQIVLLRRIANGEQLAQMSTGKLFFWRARPSTGPRTASAQKLIEAGFIAKDQDRLGSRQTLPEKRTPRNRDHWYSGEWIITEAGRQFLAEYGAIADV